MAEWLISYGSWALAPWGLLGMWATGRKKTWGWLLALTTQCLWALYAVGTAQYGFLLGTTAYAAVYLKNWVTWRRDDRAVTDEAPAPVTGMQQVFRVHCTGRCGSYLRKGRTIPAHWGEAYAEVFPTGQQAAAAAVAAGWTGGVCPKDQVTEGAMT